MIDLEQAKKEAADKLESQGQATTNEALLKFDFVADKLKIVEAATKNRMQRIDQYKVAIEFGKGARDAVLRGNHTIIGIAQRLYSAERELNTTRAHRARAEHELKRATAEAAPDLVLANFEANKAAQELAIAQEATAKKEAVA